MEFLKNNLLKSLVGLIVFAITALWAIYKSSLVKSLSINCEVTISVLGWIIVILLCLLIISLVFNITEYLKNKNPFKNCTLDKNTGVCIVENDSKHYCPSCWGKNLKYPVQYEYDTWLCTNRDCKNSEHPKKGKQY